MRVKVMLLEFAASLLPMTEAFAAPKLGTNKIPIARHDK
jgi:hypothetical protein